MARDLLKTLIKFLISNFEGGLFVNIQSIRLLSWFTWAFKKHFAEHSMMAASIKINNYLWPSFPNTKLAFLFLSWNLLVDFSQQCFFPTPLMVAAGNKSCRISSVQILQAFFLAFSFSFYSCWKIMKVCVQA